VRDRIFYSIVLGFILGVLLRTFVFLDLYVALLFSVISFFLILFFNLISKNRWGIIAGVFILAFSFGILRFHLADKPAPEFFESQVGQKVNFSGEIVDEPDIRESGQKLEVSVAPQGLALGSLKARPFPTTEILITTDFEQDFKYGDKINFSGKLERPENFITDQGKEFDYINYLKKDGILYVMSYPKIQIVSNNNGNPIKVELFSLKEKFLSKMNFAISPPENLFMGGLILGEKSSFNQAMTQSFINTGTIHIVALSGYNVTIVAEWIMKLFSFLPKNFDIGVGILAILLFILMTGGSSTAIRAGIMATLALVARATGRNYDIARALILAGVLMIIFNPLLLVYDVSFQLSFMATVAVIFLSPKIEKYFLWVTEKFSLRDIVSVTVAAYLFVMPFILYKMGNLSFVALPANVLILPFIPFTMLLGFLTGFAGLLWYVLAVPIGYVAYLFLHYELGVIGFFSNLPFAAFFMSDFPLWLTLLIYIYFIYRLFGRNIKKFFEFPS